MASHASSHHSSASLPSAPVPAKANAPLPPATPADEPLDEPEHLSCPICYTLFRDPVHLSCERAHNGLRGTYERDAIVAFWRRRPLASFFGGPALPSARMEPATRVREQVTEWLAQHPELTPSGWESREPGEPSSQEVLDRLADEVERLAAVRSAAEATEAAELARGAGGAAAEAAIAVLRSQAVAVRIEGATPSRREFTGRYIRCDHLPLVGGRFAFAKEGEPDKMLWYARNGFWHAGRAVDLGRMTGYLIVSDSSGSPEHIIGEWQVEARRGFIPAPGLRCVADDRRTARTGAEREPALRGIGAEALADGDTPRYTYELGEEEEAEAHTAANLADAAPFVCLEGALPHNPFVRAEVRAAWDQARPWLGTYVRCDRRLVNGRFAYVHRRRPTCMLWFAHGFWHLGQAEHLGEQTAAIYVADHAVCPEAIGGVWHVGTPCGWTAARELRIRAGEASVRQRTDALLPSWGLRLSVFTAIVVGALVAVCLNQVIEVVVPAVLS